MVGGRGPTKRPQFVQRSAAGLGTRTPPLRREAAPVCERGDVHSWLSGQPHDGNLAIGLLLVFAIAGSDLRDTGERLSPLLALQ